MHILFEFARLFILMKAYQHPQRIHANGACSLVWFGGELWVVGRIRTTQLRVQKLDSLVVDTTAVSRSPFSGVADNNKFFCGWQKMGIY
jgi:hypothetical protein